MSLQLTITMDTTVKRTIAVAVSILILGVSVYGSYLPLRKAQMFITTLQGLQTNPVSSLQDLENRVTTPLDYPSPIGQEELVRNLANSVLGFVQQGSGATSTAEIVGFLNSYYDPILDRGKGMSFGQDLYLEGAINEIAFAETGGSTYLADAQKYYEEARADGPNRPQALFGLFDVYRAEGNVTGTIQVGDTILNNWPAETSVSTTLQQFLQEASVITATGTKKK